MTPKKEKKVNPVIEALDLFMYGDTTLFDKDAYLGELNKNEEYHEVVKNASRYISVKGMFEKKNGFEFTVMDENLNKNDDDWKKYDTQIVVNNAGLEELQIDMSDVVLSGT